MIKLDIHEYCNNCPDFKARTSSNIIESSDGTTKIADHIVSCVNDDRCKAIKRYLERN